MEQHGLSATDVGAQFGLNGRVTNRLLEGLGILEGGPGDWRITEKGAALATAVQQDNGWGGYAHREWELKYFDPRVLDEITPELVERARNVDIAYRLQKKLERAASKEEAEAVFLAFQEKQAVENGPIEIDWKKVVAYTLGAVTVIGGTIVIVKYGPAIKQRWAEVAAPRIESLKRRMSRLSSASGDTSEGDPNAGDAAKDGAVPEETS